MEFFDESFLSCELTRRIERIGVHTAAAGSSLTRTGYDTTPSQVHAWHRARGWAGAGYNELYGLKGQLYALRDPNVTPAAVKGFNRRALHVCCAGHHDFHEWPAPQFVRLTWRCAYNVVRSGLYEKYLLNSSRLLGHNEFWAHRLVPSVIRKTCPGTQVSMKGLRLCVRGQLERWRSEYAWGQVTPVDWRVLDERAQEA